MKRIAIINVNLVFKIPDSVKTKSDLEDFYMNVELPKEYCEDSFEFVKAIDEETGENLIKLM